MRAKPCWISTNESGPHCNKQFIDGNTNYPKSSPWPENIYLGAWGKIQSEGAKASQEEITDMMPRKRNWLKISEGNIKLGSYTCIFLYLKVENIIKKLMYCFFFQFKISIEKVIILNSIIHLILYMHRSTTIFHCFNGELSSDLGYRMNCIDKTWR